MLKKNHKKRMQTITETQDLKRNVDQAIKETFNTLGQRFVLISRTKIKTWKSLAIITFVAGAFGALIWAVSQGEISKIYLAGEEEITNQATVTFEDAEGNKYGPVTSNIVTTKISGEVEFDISRDNNLVFTELGNNKIGKIDLDGNVEYYADRPLNYQVKKITDNPVGGTRYSVSTGIGVDFRGNVWISTITKHPIPKGKSRFANWEFGRIKIRPEYAQFEVFDNNGILLAYIPVPQASFKWRIMKDRLLMVNEYMTEVYEYKIAYYK